MKAARPDRRSDAPLALVPPERRDGVRAALAEAFGAASPTRLSPIAGGVSAQIYRTEVGGRDYLVRLERGRTALRDPERSFACMQAAAHAGIAPRVLHADPASAVAIMEFVHVQPLETFPGGPAALAAEIGRLLARVQRLPTFPAVGDYPTIVERMLAFVRGTGLFAPGLLDPHAEGMARIREAYPWDAAALVSSHNDPNPRNILYDGERLWLIDWETAFRNDPLADIAIVTAEIAVTPELEAALLDDWLGRSPDARTLARLALIRPMTQLYYACLLLMASAQAPRQAPHADLQAPSLAEFRLAVAEGGLSPTGPKVLELLGKMQLAAFLAGVKAPGFEDAMALLRAG